MLVPKKVYSKKICLILLSCVFFRFVLYNQSMKDFFREPHIVFFKLNYPTGNIYGMDHFKSKLPALQYNFEPEDDADRKIRVQRREAVKKSFQHAWKGYKSFAFGADELKPLTVSAHNPFGGMGTTILDSIGTMIIMGLDREVEDTIPFIENINPKVDREISVFETQIRCLGGLLSAYELSNHPKKKVFLDKAEEFGNVIISAYDTPTGFPRRLINPIRGTHSGEVNFFSDGASSQVELIALSRHTGNPIFAEKVKTLNKVLDNASLIIPGLFPVEFNVENGRFVTNSVNFGPRGDSAYEYMLKEYILSDGEALNVAKRYKESVDAMKSHILIQNSNSTMLYITDVNVLANRTTTLPPYPLMYHLSCFAPGMLAMGSKLFDRPEDMDVARGILETCVHMYRSTETNLSADEWHLPINRTNYNPQTYTKPKYTIKKPYEKMPELEVAPEGLIHADNSYYLRPETVESLYVFYRMTGDPIYQELGWMIYQGIEKNCKTPVAYASVKYVDPLPKQIYTPDNQWDSMETFLFAETFKYLYLLFSPPDVISLDKFVMNTEAHPIMRQ